jgi:hypothetical protein
MSCTHSHTYHIITVTYACLIDAYRHLIGLIGVSFLQDLQNHLLPPPARATMSSAQPPAATAASIIVSLAASPPSSPAINTGDKQQHPLLRFASYFKMYTQVLVFVMFVWEA